MGKSNYSITHQMHIDLMEAYKRVSQKCWSQWEAYERMVKEPAPRFYVTPKQAYQVILRMAKGDFDEVNRMRKSRRKMYYALFDVVFKLSQRRGFMGRSLAHIVEYAVLEPAPEFYISASRGKRIRSHLKRGLYEDGKLINP